MKYLIVGLGNIGDQYQGTRHNMGCDVLDHLVQGKEGKWKTEHLGSIARIKHKGRHLILLKPSTYVNLSGKAVRYWLQKEKLKKDRLLVVVDDIHLDFGKVRLRARGSDAGHNGIMDINQKLGSDYARLKVGIGADFHQGQQVNYVLGKWSSEEIKLLPEIIKHCSKAIYSFASIGLSRTMSAFNR